MATRPIHRHRASTRLFNAPLKNENTDKNHQTFEESISYEGISYEGQRPEQIKRRKYLKRNRYDAERKKKSTKNIINILNKVTYCIYKARTRDCKIIIINKDNNIQRTKKSYKKLKKYETEMKTSRRNLPESKIKRRKIEIKI